MTGLFVLLFIVSILAGLYFLVRLIISFIKKNDSRKKYGIYLAVCMVICIVFVVGVAETHVPKPKTEQPNTSMIEMESDLNITPMDFVKQYNQEIDAIAQKDGKKYDDLKIDPKEVTGLNGVFQTKGKRFNIGWGKSKEEAPNMCYIMFSNAMYTEQSGKAMVAAVAVITKAIGTDKGMELFRKDNLDKIRTTLKDKGYVFDLFIGKDSLACVISDEKYYDSISKLQCYEADNKIYCIQTDTMMKDIGSWNSVKVDTLSSDKKTSLETILWNFRRDDNFVFYKKQSADGIETGKASDNELAAAVYSTLKQNEYLIRHVNIAEHIRGEAKQSQQQVTGVQLNYKSGEYTYYVLDKSISWNPERTRVQVDVQKRSNGKVIGTETWKFGKVGGREWRYSSSTMDKSHDSVVISGDLSDAILQKCLEY